MDVSSAKQQNHFVLVHGTGHGAWCWYKLKPLLESAGHRVTAIDLSASGINTRSLHELWTLHDYSIPLIELMAAIPPEEKVILVGHSYGGINMALAMDIYPEKVLVAVYVAALMPDTINLPSYVLNQYWKWIPEGHMLDSQFQSYGTPEDPARTAVIFGPQYISSKLYRKCSTEDIELAKMLVRPMFLFLEDLSKAKAFSSEGYGSVERVYITCSEDKAFPVEFQRWLIENIGVIEVKEIRDADHIPMLSKSQELYQCLLDIADKYS